MQTRSDKDERVPKTITRTVSIWYDEKTEHIHLAVPETDWFHSTINNREGSVRQHANLFKKLGKLLRDAGVSAPKEPTQAPQPQEEDG
jgi:hypothetical protein